MPSTFMISMRTPASLYFLRNALALSIGAARRHLVSASITAGSVPRPSTSSFGAPMNVSIGCERSSSALTPMSTHFFSSSSASMFRPPKLYGTFSPI